MEDKDTKNICNICKLSLDEPNQSCANERSHRSSNQARAASAESPKEAASTDAFKQQAENKGRETQTKIEDAEKALLQSPVPASPNPAPSIKSLLQSLVTSLSLLLRSPLIWLAVQLEMLVASDPSKEDEEKKNMGSERDSWFKKGLTIVGLLMLFGAIVLLGPHLRKLPSLTSVIIGGTLEPTETPNGSNHGRHLIHEIKQYDDQVLKKGAKPIFEMVPEDGVDINKLRCTYTSSTKGARIEKQQGCTVKVEITEYQPKLWITLSVKDVAGMQDEENKDFNMQPTEIDAQLIQSPPSDTHVITEIKVLSRTPIKPGDEVRLEARFFDSAVKDRYTCHWWSSAGNFDYQQNCSISLRTNGLPSSVIENGIRVQVRLKNGQEQFVAMKEEPIKFRQPIPRSVMRPIPSPSPNPTSAATPVPSKPEEQSKPSAKTGLP